jgi:hypothetical protein
MGKNGSQMVEKVIKVITPVGTSLFDNLKDGVAKKIKTELKRIKNKSYWRDFKERGRSQAEVKKICLYLIGQKCEDEIKKSRSKKSYILENLENSSISAEISVINKLVNLYFSSSKEEVEDDRSNSPQKSNPSQGNVKLEVHLFPSDSLEGYICAKAIEFYIRNREDWEGKVKVENHEPVENLRIDSKKEFEEGIENFINEILEVAQTEGKFSFNDTIFNITGGYKAIIAYLATLGQITQSKMYYLFEKKDEILELPLLPIGFDDQVVRLYLPLLRRFVIHQLLDGSEEDKKLLSDLKRFHFIKEEEGTIKITAFGELLKYLENHFTGSFGYLMELILKEKLEKSKDEKECDVEINVTKGINGDIDLLKKCNDLIEVWEIKSLSQITKFFAGEGENPKPQYPKYLRFLKENGKEKRKKLVLFIYLLKTSKTTDLIDRALQNERFNFKEIQQEMEDAGIEFEIKYMEIPRKFLEKNTLIQNLHKLEIQTYNFGKE